MESDSRRSQYSLAEDVIRRIFAGDVTIKVRPQGLFTVDAVGSPRLDGLEEAVLQLRKWTGPSREIDPFENADGTAWVIVGQVLSQWRLSPLALNLMSRYLTTCYDLQNEFKRRIHKGAPLFWVSVKYLENGQAESSQAYMFLAFIEDCHHYKDPMVAPAYQYLVGIFGLSGKELALLARHARSVLEYPMYPEQILFEWKIKRIREGPTHGSDQ